MLIEHKKRGLTTNQTLNSVETELVASPQALIRAFAAHNLQRGEGQRRRGEHRLGGQGEVLRLWGQKDSTPEIDISGRLRKSLPNIKHIVRPTGVWQKGCWNL